MADERQQYMYEFGTFCLDTRERVLLRDGRPIPVTPKALEILLVLVRSAGQIVLKEELIQQVWPDTFIEEGNLSVHIFALRKALGERSEGQSYIETIPRRGYRFTAPVSETSREQTFLVERRSSQVVVIEQIESDELEPFERNPPPLALTTGRKWKRGTYLLAAVLPLIVVGFLIYFGFFRTTKRVRPHAVLRSIAVLPFRPINAGNTDEDYLGVGITDAVITRLGTVDEIQVRPTSAVLRFDRSTQDSLAAARSLGVDAVIEGKYQRQGDRVRVTVQLVSVQDGMQLWSSTFDEKLENLFTVLDSISTEIARELLAGLGEAERRLESRRPSNNAEAYRAFLRGRFHWNKRTQEGLAQAEIHLNEAIRLDPQFAPAHAGLADTHLLLCNYVGERPQPCYAKAKAAAIESIRLDPLLADGHATIAFINYRFEHNWSEAEKAFREALQLSPNHSTAHQWYGEFLGIVGRHEESIAELRLAHQLDPLSLIINTDLGAAYYVARQYDAAVEQLKKTIELDRAFPLAHLFLGMTYKQKGMFDLAIAESKQAVELSKGRTVMLATLGNVYASSGNKTEALAILDQLKARAKTEHVPAFEIALVYVGLEVRDMALEWLEKSSEANEYLFVYLKVDPNLDALRKESRFIVLMERMRFQ